MKKLLKLQDHHHTAKRLAHHHTSYRALFLITALFGVSLLFIQRTVGADSYVVTARIAAPVPTIAAEITNPTGGMVVSNANTIISGTCPIIVPAVIVEIYRNNQLMGSTVCTNDGKFTGTYTLAVGTNTLQPRVRTITDDYGPDGSAKTVTLLAQTVSPTPSVPNTGTTATSQTASTAQPEFQIITQAPFLVIKQNESLVWRVNITGGTSPYSIVVDWGDGTKSTYAASSSGEQVLDHVFKQNKNTVVKISVRDANGKEVYTSVAGVSFRAKPTPAVGGVSETVASGLRMPLATMWISYVFLVTLITAFWVGIHFHSNGRSAVNKRRKPHKR